MFDLCRKNCVICRRFMNTLVSLTLKSQNAKTGEIPVSTSGNQTCPKACPFNNGNGCYAASGHTAIHWRRISEGKKGMSFSDFCEQIALLPKETLWRHNEAGDLQGDTENIDFPALEMLVHANEGKKGFTYTHYSPAVGNNATAIKFANTNGFTVNLSADNLTEADEFMALGIGPVVCVVPESAKNGYSTPNGNRIVICPNAVNKKTQCVDCGLCQLSSRKAIIGFPAHGTRKKKVSEIVAK